MNEYVKVCESFVVFRACANSHRIEGKWWCAGAGGFLGLVHGLSAIRAQWRANDAEWMRSMHDRVVM